MKPKRIVDEDLLEAVRQMPCCACNYPPRNDPHHIKSKGAGGPDLPWNLVSLDRYHHRELHRIGLIDFTEKYPLFKKILERKGWTFCKVRNKWVHDE